MSDKQHGTPTVALVGARDLVFVPISCEGSPILSAAPISMWDWLRFEGLIRRSHKMVCSSSEVEQSDDQSGLKRLREKFRMTLNRLPECYDTLIEPSCGLTPDFVNSVPSFQGIGYPLSFDEEAVRAWLTQAIELTQLSKRFHPDTSGPGRPFTAAQSWAVSDVPQFHWLLTALSITPCLSFATLKVPPLPRRIEREAWGWDDVVKYLGQCKDAVAELALDDSGTKNGSGATFAKAELGQVQNDAYDAFELVEKIAGKTMKCPTVHNWIKEHGLDWETGDPVLNGATVPDHLRDYQLPDLETFKRYVGEGRMHFGTQRNVKRQTGPSRSAVRPDGRMSTE